MKGAAKAKKATTKEPKVAESKKPKVARPVEVDDDMIMTLEVLVTPPHLHLALMLSRQKR